MAKIGYIRVSSADQNTDRQRDALQALGVEKLFEDKASGKDTSRPALQKLLEYVREGDTVYFESISRLARNTRDFLELMEAFAARGVCVVSLKEPIDTTTPAGRMTGTIFAALAEMEREYIKSRQREGIDAAKKRGKYLGRPRVELPGHWKRITDQWQAGQMTAVEAMRRLEMSRATFYRLARREGISPPGHRREEKP